MRIAILVMAHRLPEQVAVLCERLLHHSIDIYIHVDKKEEEKAFKEKIQIPKINFIKKRTNIQWGAFSIVETIITCFEEIISRNKYDYICNLSGQDLPIKSMDQLIAFLYENAGKEFIENIPFEKENRWWNENARRVETYSFINMNFIGKFRIENFFNLLLPKRRPPENIIFSGNSGWFCLSSSAVSFVISSFNHQKELTRYFKFVWGADEIYFSTVLYNSPFRNKMIGNLLHTEWLPSDKLHPKVFTAKDKIQLQQSNKFFARKFDSSIDKEIIEFVHNLSDLKN